MSIRAPIGYVARTSAPMALNQGCRALVPSPGSDVRFLTYALVAFGPELDALGRGTTFMEVSAGQFAALSIPRPPLAEQRAIADYLDRETAQIDALIGKLERLIETLRERRAALLDTTLGEYVGSGERLKWNLREVDRRAGHGWTSRPLMSVSIAWGVRRREEVTEDESRAEDLATYKECEPGDIVLNRMRAFQGALGVSGDQGVVSPDYAVLRTHSTVEPRWLAAVMRSRIFVAEMSRRVRGIGGTDAGNVRTPRINVADLQDIRVSSPSRVEQSAVLSHANEQTAKIDTLISKAERFIALAKERRSALITAAVTGQIDVRAAA